jgi:hypothetical protein
MLTCERCGAGIPPNVDTCGYCGTVSEQARVVLRTDQARERHFANQQAAQLAVLRQKAFSATEQAATRALTWGLLGFVFVCVPVPGVLAYLSFSKAQRAAREGGVELPLRAKLGLACGAFNVLAFLGVFVWMIVDIRAQDARVEARKNELTAQIAQHATTAQLDQPYACQLAELYVLSSGFAGSTDTGSFRNLRCGGALHVLGERAELDDFKLEASSTSGVTTATFCFKHGEHWFVESAGVISCALK